MKSRIYWESTKADDKIIKNLKDSGCLRASVSAIFLPGPFPTSSVSLCLSLSVCRSALPLLCSVLCQLHAAGHTAAGPLESHPQRRGNAKQGPLQMQTGKSQCAVSSLAGHTCHPGPLTVLGDGTAIHAASRAHLGPECVGILRAAPLL